MPLITDLRCGICGAQRRVAWGGVCLATDSKGRECLAETWELAPPKPDPDDPFYVTSLPDAPKALIPEQFEAPLAQALGGIVRGYSIIVGGVQGVGKSTLCAQLASEMTRQKGLIFWCDADQGGDLALIGANFAHTHSPADALRIVARRPGMEDVATSEHLMRKLRALAKPIDVCVFDSLQKWAPINPGAFVESLREIASTKLVISRNNKEGQLFGTADSAYECDAVALIFDGSIEVPDKCRWSRTPRSAPWTKTDA